MSHASAAQMKQVGARLDADSLLLARLVEGFERDRGYEADGCPNSVSWLKTHCRLSTGMAMEIVSVARQLPQLPVVEKAAERGEIGFQHAAVIAESAEKLGSDSLFTRQAELVQAAEQVDPAAFRVEMRRVEHQVDAEKMAREAEAAYSSRRLRVSDMRDGRVRLDGILDGEGGTVVKKALEAAMGPRAFSETRSEQQRRADGLVDVARRALAGREFGQTGCQRPHLNVAVDLDRGEAEICGLGPISEKTLERLLCDCALSVNDSPEVRTFSAPKRRALALKKRHCHFPGCSRPVEWCEGHHLDWWVDGGRTVPGNGALPCGFHHRQVHEGRWRLLKEGDELVAISPDGERHRSAKAPPAA